MIVSLVKHFTENDENTICIAFQFYNQKLSLERCFKSYVYYTRLCTGRSTKKQTDSFFRRAIYEENHENIISVCFQFYISKSGDMFHTLSTIWDDEECTLPKKTLIAYFLDHFKKIKIWYISVVSFVILDVLYSLSTLQRYKQSALRKKELIAFFGEYFNENTICIVKVKRVVS